MISFIYFFSFIEEFAGTISAEQDSPETWHHWKITLLESLIDLEFHSSTGHAGDSDCLCIFLKHIL